MSHISFDSIYIQCPGSQINSETSPEKHFLYVQLVTSNLFTYCRHRYDNGILCMIGSQSSSVLTSMFSCIGLEGLIWRSIFCMSSLYTLKIFLNVAASPGSQINSETSPEMPSASCCNI